MGRGWDVLLSGERVARGRMDLGRGRGVEGVVRMTAERGVTVRCEVVGQNPLGADDLLEATLEQRRGAREVEGAVRAVA